MGRLLELPEPIYEALVAAARASGVAPADWIAAKLPNESVNAPPNGDSSTGLEKLLRHAGSIDLGYPTGTDNEAIDADLARAYGGTHEEEC